MQDRAQRADRLMRYIAWLSRLKLTGDEALRLNAARNALLDALPAGRVDYAFGCTKVYTGSLSPGCLTCGQGTWSCMFVNGLCTANCFFCPQDRSQDGERPPSAEGIAFADPDGYADYLERFGFRGVGFSGGEPLLVLDKLLAFVRAIKRRFGQRMFVWIYTNGDLADVAALGKLTDAGLDELRFDIAARVYDLQRVARARPFVDRLTVEIPAIPEDFERVRDCLPEIQRIGVDHLNVHQLTATQHNYQRLSGRGYTFLRPIAFHESPVVESELAALSLLQHAAEQGLGLSINYCTHAYKARFQRLARRGRAAALACQPSEQVTGAGYIRGLQPDPDGAQPGMTLRYFEADLTVDRVPRTVAEIPFSPGRSLFVKRRQVAQYEDLNPDVAGALWDARDDGTDRVSVLGIEDIRQWEQLDTGFPDIE